jgi:SIR2-like protein
LAAVRYYLQWIITQSCGSWRSVTRSVTNYVGLLDQIELVHKGNERVALVTFNYDTLLEEALSHFGLDIGTFSDYTQKHPFYRVFKVHGSVNWGRILTNKIESQNPTNPNLVASEWIRKAAELNITDEYVLSPGMPTAIVGGRPAFPAIAIPVERGKNFECPASLIAELKELLPHTSKMLVIGWRGTEQHFLDLLKAHVRAGVRLAPSFWLHIVAGNAKDAQDARVNICEGAQLNHPNDQVSQTGEGFTGFMTSGDVKKFLA